MSVTLNLPNSTETYGDVRLALYCLPFVSDILRIATSVNTLAVLKQASLTEEQKLQTRLDISKWAIGSIAAGILALASPLTGTICAIVATVAILFTLYEQASICFSAPSLSGRAASASAASQIPRYSF